MTTSFDFDPTASLTPAPSSPSPGAGLALIPDHELQAHAKLILFFQKKQLISELCKGLVSCLQDPENVAWSLHSLGWNPDNLGGVNLDVLGEIVGEPRAGRTDAQYRPAIKVRILVNSSDGKAEQIYAILTGLAPLATVVWVQPQYPAALTVTMDSTGGASVQTVYQLLREAVGAGIRVNLTVSATQDIGSSDGSPAGGIIGSSDGNPAGFVIGSGA